MAEFIVYECIKCGMTSFPKHARCPRCKAAEFREVPVEHGVVTNFTTLFATRPGFAKPLTLAIVEFPNSVKALAQLEATRPHVGMKVTTSYGRLNEKDLGLKFVPADQSN